MYNYLIQNGRMVLDPFFPLSHLLRDAITIANLTQFRIDYFHRWY